MPFCNTRTTAVLLGISVCSVTGYLIYLLYKKDEDNDYIDTMPRKADYKMLEIKIPKEMVCGLIGRNGKNIKMIETQSNTKIHFKDGDDSKDRTCIIKGRAENCYLAENLIQEFLSNQTIIECEEMFVQQNFIGKIIGKCGENIMEIMARSGAKVHISEDADRLEPTRRVMIKGSRNQIEIAKSMITEIIEHCQIRQSQLEVSLAKREPRLPAKSPSPKPPIENASVERLSPIPGQTDSPFEVYVSAMVDPSHFWIQIVGPKATELDQLVEEMTEYYNQSDNREFHTLKKVNPGDLVAAVFQYDNKWYRAEVLSLIAENGKEPHAELYFVDYGDTEVVPTKSIYELRTDFLQLHFQAIECYLAQVEPVGDNWSEEAIDAFEEWTHVAQWKKLSARINGYCNREKTRAKRESSPVPGIDLYDVVNNQDVDIAQELVNHRFATYKEDVEKRSVSSRTTSISNISVDSNS